MKHIVIPSLIATAVGAGLLMAAISSSSAAEDSACTAGNGRYQLATAIYNEFKTTIYETVVDTCTGDVVRREEIKSGAYK